MIFRAKIFMAGMILFFALPLSVFAAPLRFNEIMYYPAGASIGNQWVELFNPGPDTITISGADQNNPWKFFDSYGGHLIHLTQGSLEVPAGGFLILASDGNNFLRQYPNFQGSVATVFMALRENCGDFIELRDGSGNIIDESSFTNSLGAAGNNKTLEFDGKNWRESLIDGGTPGAINSVQGVLLAPPPSPLPCITPYPKSSSAAASNLPAPSEQTSTPQSASSSSSGLSIFPLVSEFMPSAGWIELYNQFDSPLYLDGWAIGTGSGAKNYKLRGTLRPKDYLVLASSSTNLSLKENGDEIKLFDPSGKQFYVIKYANPLPPGASAARFGSSGWQITDQPTPGSANILAEDITSNPNFAPVQIFTASGTDLQNTASAENSNSDLNASRNIIVLAIGLLAGIAAIIIAVFLKRNYL